MVGVAGFEPAHDGIKTRCLATWLHPIWSQANQRLHAPAHLPPKYALARAFNARNCEASTLCCQRRSEWLTKHPVIDDKAHFHVVIDGGQTARQELSTALSILRDVDLPVPLMQLC